jgi:hypothetical protein
MESSIDSRVVRTIRSLRKLQSTADSFSTRTSTPSHENQVIEIISNREELNSFRETLTSSEIYEVIKNDSSIISDLMTEPSLSAGQIRKIHEKLQEFIETKKIQIAKQSISAKIQERMESLKKQLADSI